VYPLAAVRGVGQFLSAGQALPAMIAHNPLVTGN
jgi:hypothetical protein